MILQVLMPDTSHSVLDGIFYDMSGEARSKPLAKAAWASTPLMWPVESLAEGRATSSANIRFLAKRFVDILLAVRMARGVCCSESRPPRDKRYNRDCNSAHNTHHRAIIMPCLSRCCYGIIDGL